MTTAGKTMAIAALGGLLGMSVFMWTAFGNDVYFAYLSGAVMRCF